MSKRMPPVEWDYGVRHVSTKVHVRRDAAVECDFCGKPIEPGDEYVITIAQDGNKLMMSRDHVRHWDSYELANFLLSKGRV